MQNTSALYNQIMADINHRFEVKLSINGVDYGVDSIFSAKTESRIFDSKPTIGGCYCATLDFTILSDGVNIPRMASVVPYFRVVNDTQQSEWIQHGLYYIDQRKTTNNGDGLSVFTAECFDAMLKANAAYSSSGLSWPAVDTQIVPEIATAIGVPVDQRTTAILTKRFSIADLPVNYTYRDVLSFIAVAYAGNWIITDEGKLRLVPIAGNNDTLLIDKELMSMNVSPKRNGYTKVVITTSEGEAVESGLSDDVVMEAYCPYATQAIADDVLATLSTYQYEPFDASGVWSNPAVEVGDKITAVEKTVVSYARTVNFGPGMVMNLSAPDDGYIDHEYAYESPTERHYKQTIGDIKREIVVTEESIVSTISRRLDSMQEQIDNNIETFTGPAVPTLTNYPANAWTTTEEKDKHIGDLYVVNSQGGDYEGFYYRFEKTGSTYQWRLLKDTEVTKALADAEEALRRVGIAETQIEQNAEAITLRATKTEAQGYANTAQANAISAAASDATTKANAAESAAKSYADAQITISADAITSNVSATYETKTDATGKLNTAKTYAEGQASAAETNAKGYTDGKLTDYSTTAQMNSAIEQTASNITSTVSATYETKTDATSKLNTAKTYAEGQASAAETNAKTAAQGYANTAEGNAKGYTDGKLTDYSTTVQMNSAIEQTASNITSTVSATYETKSDATSKLNTAKTYADGKAATAESNAKTAAQGYADAAEEAANDYTDGKLVDYSTTTQMESAISQSASDITSTVSATYETKAAATQKLNTAKSYAETQAADAEAAAISTAAADATTKANAAEAGAKGYTDNKLTGYSTTTQMNSAISQSAGSILQTVSETYTTKTEFGGLEDDVEAVETRVSSAESTLEVQAGQIASKVSETDYNGNTIASKINQTATTVKINAAKIDLQGAVTISDFNSAAQAALVKNTTTKNQYAQSASSTTAPTSGWQDTIPAYNATNKYIWLRVATTKTFADNTSSTTYSTPVVDVNLTKSIQDAATAQSTATGAATAASTAQSTADAALGTTKSTQQYYLSTSSTSATGGTWQDTVPTWSSGKYVWTRIKTDATTKSGTALSPVYSTAVYDANLTTALSTASSASSAASAAQTTANGAVKSSSVKTQYYLSTSASSATGGSWSDTIPTWADGKYLWTRIATTTTPVSGTASTTYQPSANGAYDKNLTSALSTATAAASTAAAAQTKANAALVTSVSVYFRASTSTVPGKPTAEVTSTAVDTSDAWTLCMPRPKKGTTYYTCEQNKDGNGTVSWTAVRQMANTTYVASWASSNNATYIDGANIYTGTVTADKVAANETFTQKLYASDFNILGGSVYIEAGGGMADEITLTYGGVKNSMMPYGYKIYDENYASSPMLEATHAFGTNYKSSLITLREINGSGTETERIELKPSGVGYYYSGAQKFSLGGTGLTLYDSNGNNAASYSINNVTITNGAKSILSNTNLSLYSSGGGLLSQLSQTKLTITNLESVELTNTGLVFRNASDKVTAKYLNSPTSTNYTPSNTTLTFHSDSVIKVRKLGSVGVYSILMQLKNPGDFATGTYYDILTLPKGHRPWYVVSHIACNGVGSPVYIRVNTDGVVSIYRYAGSAWTNSWIRVEIPVIFADP